MYFKKTVQSLCVMGKSNLKFVKYVISSTNHKTSVQSVLVLFLHFMQTLYFRILSLFEGEVVLVHNNI